MENLDVKDKKLIYYLSHDARASHKQLGKAIGLSQNAVKYRIERLQKSGVISDFTCAMNIGLLGLDTAVILLRFNEDVYEQKKILDYFKENGFVILISTLSGHWDLFVEFVITHQHDLYKRVFDILKTFTDSITEYRVFFSGDPLRVEELPHTFYEGLKLPELPVHKPLVAKNYKIDKLDKQILYELSTDSSQPYLHIAQKLNTNIDTVRYRIKQLKAKKILLKSFASFSLSALGYVQYFYTLSLKNVSPEQMINLRAHVQNNPSVVYAFFDITGFNMVINAAFRHSEEFDDFMRNIRKKYGAIIKREEYQMVKEVMLFSIFPKGLVE